MNASLSMRHHCFARLASGIVLLCLSLVAAGSARAQSAAPVKSKSAVPSRLAAPETPVATPLAPATAPLSRPVDAILAVVNKDVITHQELADRLTQVEKRMTAQGMALPPREQLQHQLLDRMILELAQIQMAKENGIIVDDADLDRAVSRVADQNKFSMQEFRAQLAKEKIDFVAFREDIRREIIMQRLREREVNNKVQITESEVDNYRQAVAKQEDLNLSHILIRVPEKASPEQVTARRQRAEDVLRQLKTGADFAKTAASYSDGSDALSGGGLGWRAQDRFPQLFVDAVASLKPGEVSAIVKSSNGFHIIKLLDRRATSAATVPALEQTHVRHILIKVNQIVSSAEARRKLLELKERLDHKAATFEELAKLFSNDLSASKGGDLGWIYPGDTVPEFERAMNGLKPGEVSQPIESPFGFHLIEVLERKTDEASQERVRQAARQALRERKIDEATEDWLRQLRDRAYVEMRDDKS